MKPFQKCFSEVFFLWNPLNISLCPLSVIRVPTPQQHLHFFSTPKHIFTPPTSHSMASSPCSCAGFSQSSDQFPGCSGWFDIYLTVFGGWNKRRVPLLLHYLNSSACSIFLFLHHLFLLESLLFHPFHWSSVLSVLFLPPLGVSLGCLF